MRAHKQEFSIEKMAKVLCVSRNGFYSPRCLKSYQEIDPFILEIFTQHKGRYGSPRIHANLKDKGFFVANIKAHENFGATRRKEKAKD